ncbi:MAG: hypothetical protein IKK77_00605 [Clostridia bacterium]|nr:hypothetical protein [Clostridia bacterium]
MFKLYFKKIFTTLGFVVNYFLLCGIMGVIRYFLSGNTTFPTTYTALFAIVTLIFDLLIVGIIRYKSVCDKSCPIKYSGFWKTYFTILKAEESRAHLFAVVSILLPFFVAIAVSIETPLLPLIVGTIILILLSVLAFLAINTFIWNIVYRLVSSEGFKQRAQHTGRVIGKGLQYFAMFQASIFASMLILLLFMTPIRFVVENEIIQLWIFAALGFVIEIIAITYCFYKEKIDFKTVGFLDFISPCIIGVFLHFVLSYLNGFHMYTAGASVSESGILWQSYVSEILITDMREVALFRLIIPFVIILTFRIGAVILGYYLGKKKVDKTRQELLEET